MKYISTRNRLIADDFLTATLKGLAPDGGLYQPECFPEFSDETIKKIFQAKQIAEVGKILFQPFVSEIPEKQLSSIFHNSLNFSVPLIHLHKNIYLLELFHGPTFAFKDVGARCMAGLLGYFLQAWDKQLDILVATSGDTGSAVAHGFYGVPGIRVFVLYPSGRISFQQEQQITTLGGNIFPLENRWQF